MADYEEEAATNLHILEIVTIDNLVDELDDDLLTKIGDRVVTSYDADKESMNEWTERNDEALKLTNLKNTKSNDPWDNAANTKLPLILNAAMKASAEEVAEIMRGTEIIQSTVFGKKTPEKMARARRVKQRMSHQIQHELEDWADDQDKLIMAKNILGTVHKKVFYSDGKIQVKLRRFGIVINDNVETLKEARVTDEIEKFGWQITEKFNSGEWATIDFNSDDPENKYPEEDEMSLFLEQIRREDLDGDGYPEPYIVTVHKATMKVVRITPRA